MVLAPVDASDVVILECFPEFGGVVRSYQLAEHLMDETRGVGFAESEHIAFRIQPISQIGSFDEEFASVRTDKVLSVNADKRL